jgi:hypothetical protein
MVSLITPRGRCVAMAAALFIGQAFCDNLLHDFNMILRLALWKGTA